MVQWGWGSWQGLSLVYTWRVENNSGPEGGLRWIATSLSPPGSRTSLGALRPRPWLETYYSQRGHGQRDPCRDLKAFCCSGEPVTATRGLWRTRGRGPSHPVSLLVSLPVPECRGGIADHPANGQHTSWHRGMESAAQGDPGRPTFMRQTHGSCSKPVGLGGLLHSKGCLINPSFHRLHKNQFQGDCGTKNERQNLFYKMIQETGKVCAQDVYSWPNSEGKG